MKACGKLFQGFWAVGNMHKTVSDNKEEIEEQKPIDQEEIRKEVKETEEKEEQIDKTPKEESVTKEETQQASKKEKVPIIKPAKFSEAFWSRGCQVV